MSFFSTFDLGLATVLSLSFPIESLNKSNSKKVEFVFKRQPGLDELVQRYWAKDLSVEPQLLFSNLKHLKNRLYSSF